MTAIGTYEFTIEGDRLRSTWGTNFGPGTRLHHLTAKVIVLKTPGHKRFGGQGSPRIYQPAAFRVFKITSRTGSFFTAEQIVRFEVRA